MSDNEPALHGRRILIVLVAVALPLFTSYAVLSAWRRRPATQRFETHISAPLFASGRYLVAYVFVTSKCGFCMADSTKAAVRRIRSSLRQSGHSRFVDVSVVGVAIDEDVKAELAYLDGLGTAGSVFDEISAGGSWMNKHLANVVWRDGFASPQVPQVVLVETQVDASGYPRHIDVSPESLIYHVVGQDVVTWVNAGTPIPRNQSEVAISSSSRLLAKQ